MAALTSPATRTSTEAVKRAAATAIIWLAGACSPQPGGQVSAIEIVGFGVMQRGAARFRPDDMSSIGAPIGRASDVRIVEQTERIPFRPALSYGVAFVVRGAPSGAAVDVRVVLTLSSPCLLKATGQVVYENDAVVRVHIDELRHVGAMIAAGEENPCKETPGPGRETFALYHDGRKLAERTFELYGAE